MINRRSALSAAPALAAVPLVAGCATIEKWTGTTTPQAATQQLIATTQAWMPFVSAGILTAAAFVPGIASFVPLIQTGLSSVSAILANVSSTMTAMQAQPLGKQIVTAINSTMQNVHQAVAVIPPGPTATKVAAILAEADAAASALSTLVTSMAAAVPAAPTAAAVWPGDTSGLYISPAH
jgi:hypothetical protein